jgi:PAS domain S-box-containing protein
LRRNDLLDYIETQIWYFKDPETYGAVNHSHAAFFGKTTEQFISRKAKEILPSETAEILTADNLKCFSKAIPTCNTLIIQNHQGKDRHIAISKTPKFDGNNSVECVVCTGTDITEYKKLEDDLHHINSTLRTFLSASPIGIGIIENRKISWINDEMIKIFGCESSDEILGRSTKAFYANPDDYEYFADEIYRNLKQGNPVEKDLVLKRSDGSRFIGHLKMNSYDADNPAKKAVVTISNITWRKEAQEHRIQKEKLKGVIEMAGAVCHELNQPLQAILGYAELMSMDMESNNPFYEYLTTIIKQVNMMGELTGKLQKISKYETKDYLESRIIDIERSAD